MSAYRMARDFKVKMNCWLVAQSDDGAKCADCVQMEQHGICYMDKRKHVL